jgi:hypothetical protein
MPSVHYTVSQDLERIKYSLKSKNTYYRMNLKVNTEETKNVFSILNLDDNFV